MKEKIIRIILLFCKKIIILLKNIGFISYIKGFEYNIGVIISNKTESSLAVYNIFKNYYLTLNLNITLNIHIEFDNDQENLSVIAANKLINVNFHFKKRKIML
jgi:hypothetical protein